MDSTESTSSIHSFFTTSFFFSFFSITFNLGAVSQYPTKIPLSVFNFLLMFLALCFDRFLFSFCFFCESSSISQVREDSLGRHVCFSIYCWTIQILISIKVLMISLTFFFWSVKIFSRSMIGGGKTGRGGGGEEPISCNLYHTKLS